MPGPSGRSELLGLVLLVAGGCTDRPTGSDEQTSDATDAVSSGSTSEGSGGSTDDAATESSGAVDSTSTGSDDADDGPFCSVSDDDEWIAHCPPDGGPELFECDLLAQDCPLGEKCSPWATDGSAVWNGTRCSPIDRSPDPVGAPCTVLGSAVSGIDSCELGAQCWNVDPTTLEGVCVPMCTGGGSEPSCMDPDTECVIANAGAIVLCLPQCDPLLQDCEGGQLCVNDPSEALWVCMPGSGTLGADGEPCEYLNVCAGGSVCAGAEAVPGCLGSIGCCSRMCDTTLAMPECALPGTECVAWFERGMSPGIEPEGVCSVVTEPPMRGWSRVGDVRAKL